MSTGMRKLEFCQRETQVSRIPPISEPGLRRQNGGSHIVWDIRNDANGEVSHVLYPSKVKKQRKRRTGKSTANASAEMMEIVPAAAPKKPKMSKGSRGVHQESCKAPQKWQGSSIQGFEVASEAPTRIPRKGFERFSDSTMHQEPAGR
jgi:hypothetical protein